MTMNIKDAQDIESMDANSIRPLQVNDFKEALDFVKATVNGNDLDKYLDWNKLNGSF